MILRKYLYIDEGFVNDTFSAIQGFDYYEHEITNEESTSKSGMGGIDISKIKGEGSLSKENKDITNIKAQKTIPSKLQYIISHLQKEDDLPYYESMSHDAWESLEIDSIIEIAVTLSFTKIEEYSQFASLAKEFYSITGTNQSQNDATINQMIEFGDIERKNGIPCILQFQDLLRPCFAYLDEQYLNVNRGILNGYVRVLCKISRKIPQGQKIELTNIIKQAQATAKTRAQRTQIVQNIRNGKIRELQDTIKGPATEVVPMAIYK